MSDYSATQEELQPILKAMRHAYYQSRMDVTCRTEAELNQLFSIIAEEYLMEIKEVKGDE